VRALLRTPLAAKVGIAIVLFYAAMAMLGPLLAPYGEADAVGDVWEPFSAAFPLGTDSLGRDILTRMLWGATNTIGVALAATVLSFAIGMTLGYTAAVVGGWADLAISRSVDTLMAIPTLIFALVVLSVLPPSVVTLVVVIALLDSTRVFRLSRAVAMDIAVMDFVEVARLRGERLPWIVFREVLPNTLPPLIAEFGLRFCFAFLFLSSLSFLGLGIQPPAADWGGMVRDNANAISFGLMIPLIPAAAIAILTIGVNLCVDWQLERFSLARRRT
jgi:peptide/nickel transport system permease protein